MRDPGEERRSCYLSTPKWIAGRSPPGWLFAVLGYAAVLLVVFRAVWWPGSPRMFFGWDCLHEYWPGVVFQIEALRSGELPLWNPFSLMGYPFHRDPQTGFLSPMNWLLWFLSGVSGSRGAWLIQTKVLLSLWIGLLGMHLLVRVRTRSHVAGAIAALCYVLGSPLLVHKNSALLWPLLYLPWVVLALRRFVEDPTSRRAGVLGIAIWLCGSAGSPQGFFYCLLVCVPYWTFLTLLPVSGASRRLRAQVGGLSIVMLLVLGLLMPIYLPAWQAKVVSLREVPSPDFALAAPLRLRDLWELFVPNLDTHWFPDIYLGGACPLLAVIGLTQRGKSGSRDGWLWLAVSTFALLCALGEKTPVLPFLAEHIPGFGLFRIAYRYKLPFAFGLALLAGDGMAAILSAKRRGPSLRPAVLLVAAWVAAVWAVHAGLFTSVKAPDATTASAIMATIAAALIGVATGLPPGARTAMTLLVPVAFVDLWIGGLSKIDIMQPPPPLKAAQRELESLDGLMDRRYRYYSVRTRNVASIVGTRELGGYTANPLRSQRYDTLLKEAWHRPQVMAHFNVRWVIGGSDPPPGSRTFVGTHEFPSPAPLLRVYGRAEILGADEIMSRLRGHEPLSSVLIDRADSDGTTALDSLPTSEMSPLDGRLVRFARNRLVFEVTAPAPGIAVVNEVYDPSWIAEVNGRRTPIFRANHLHRAVVVPEGKSIIELRYRPLGYLAGLGFFGAALAAAALIIGFLPRGTKTR